MPLVGHAYIETVADSFKLEMDPNAVLRIDEIARTRLALYLTGGAADPQRLRITSLEHASSVGSLLGYNPATETLQHTDVSQAIAELLDEVRLYTVRYDVVSTEGPSVLMAISKAAQAGLDYLEIPMHVAWRIIALYHTQTNIFRRAGSLYAYLTGQRSSPMPDPAKLLPASPLGAEMQAKIEKERASVEDIRQMNQVLACGNCDDASLNSEVKAAQPSNIAKSTLGEDSLM